MLDIRYTELKITGVHKNVYVYTYMYIYFLKTQIDVLYVYEILSVLLLISCSVHY